MIITIFKIHTKKIFKGILVEINNTQTLGEA
jgi:hypothetical protein